MRSLATYGIVGITLKRASQAGLAHYTLPAGQLGETLKDHLHAALKVDESVYVATCNRVELVFVSNEKAGIDDVRRRFYAFFDGATWLCERREKSPLAGPMALHAYVGEGAIERLMVISAALDAMVPGEAQVLGQIKKAFAWAQKARRSGPFLQKAFDAAFAVAKKVRETTLVGAGKTSVLSLLTDLLQRRLTDARRPTRLAVVGTGEMAQQCGELFGAHKNVDVLFVNRTRDKALNLAGQYVGTAMALADFLQAPPACDVVICATAAPDIILTHSFLAQLADITQKRAPADGAHDAAALPLLIDLAVPRDIDDEAAKAVGCELWDIDRLNKHALANHMARQGRIAPARIVVDEALEHFVRRWSTDGVTEAVLRLRQNFEDEVKQIGSQLVRQWQHDSGHAQASSVNLQMAQRCIERLSQRLAHLPTQALKDVARCHGVEPIETFARALKSYEKPEQP